jgi:hypothetical protein
MSAADIREFLVSLKDVAASPFSLIAYLAVLGGWVYLGKSGQRLQEMSRRLDALKDVPESDRASILKKEYNLLPRAGLSANDYIRLQKIKLVFTAFALVIGVLFLFGIIAFVNKAPSGDGKFKPPRTDDSRNLLKVGDSASIIESIKGDERDKKEPYFAALDSALYVWRESKRYHVSATIRDEQGYLALEIKDNHWHIFPAYVSDYNYTATALEVKDNRGRVVFQIIFLSSCVAVQARFIDGYGENFGLYSLGPSEPGVISWPPKQATPQSPQFVIHPIFDYPSQQNLGKMTGLNLNCEGRTYPTNMPWVSLPLKN